MSDLFTPLRDLQPPADPLPPEEVRRLGTRRHRRRVAATVGATACLAIGAVAAGTGLSSLMTESTPPLPADRPSQTVSPDAVIPADFPLGRGLPSASQQLDMRGADNPPTGESVGAICGKPYALTGRPVDRAAIEGTNQQYLGVRDLAVYGTAGEALAAGRTLVDRLRSCPVERSPGGDTTTTVTPLTDLGDHAWQSVRTMEYDGVVSTTEYYVIVQRGSATLVLHQQGGTPSQLREGAVPAYLEDVRSETVEPMVAALCGLDDVC